MLRAFDLLTDEQKNGELIAGRSRIPRPSGPVGKEEAGGKGDWVLGTQDPLADGQQGSELIAGPQESRPGDLAA